MNSPRTYPNFWHCLALVTIFSLTMIVFPTTYAAAGTTERISVGPGGVEGNSGSFYPSISADGRYVAFHSNATNMVAPPTINNQIFVHDRTTHSNTLNSVSALTGLEAAGNSFSGYISADGRFVAFYSWAQDLVDPPTVLQSHVFVSDLNSGLNTLASVGPGGVVGNNQSNTPCISADGRLVAFDSIATNLVDPGTTNFRRNVYLHEIGGQTTLLSVTPLGEEGNDSSQSPSMSADGRYVAFSSSATDLTDAPDTNTADDVFVRDLTTDVTTRISLASDGTEADGSSTNPFISGDGRYVVFRSYATNLVADDTNGAYDIFVHDRQTGLTTRVNVDSDGAECDYASYYPSISWDGRYVAFSSDATNLVADDANSEEDVFVHDRQTGLTVRISVDPAGAESGGWSSCPVISGNGRFVAFESNATNLVAGDTNSVEDVFVRDLTGDFPPDPTPALVPSVGGGGGCFISVRD